MVRQLYLGEINIKGVLLRITKLFTGLFLYAMGIVLSINANLGLAPWDIFHQGISKHTGLTMGQASISIGVIIVLINSIFKEKLGWGTLGNMLFIGLFVDFLMLNNLIPMASGLFTGIIMMILSMPTIGFATYLYLGCSLGSGPRDGLMVVLTKRTGKSVRFIRNSIEISVSVMGYFLGGYIGLGTIITAFLLGYFVQIVFKIMKFNINDVQHRFIDEDIKAIKRRLKKKDNIEIDLDEDISI